MTTILNLPAFIRAFALALACFACSAAGCATTGTHDADDDEPAARRVPRALVALESIAQNQPQPWRTVRVHGFTVSFHSHADLARRVALRAAALWQTINAAWRGQPDAAPAQQCTVNLYDSHRELVILTGGTPKLGSADVRHSRLMRGRILSCRINLTADDHHLLGATLPHEITHVVLGQLVGRRVPLWANEGAATLAEHGAARRARRRGIVRYALAAGRAYRVADLLRIAIYPTSSRQTSIFYAESFAVVDLLVRLGGRPRFVQFLRAAHASGWTAALAKLYGTSQQQLEQRMRADIAR